MDTEAKVAELDARQRTSEHRIRDLENDLRDLRDLTNAVAVTNESVNHLKDRVEELHADVKQLSAVPKTRWETVITALITAAIGAVIGSLL
ncbi:MAG: hypothetical protein IJO59_05795 [Clostridia bacterium]|nr:hypothetical protein [Clostridia bacterium]